MIRLTAEQREQARAMKRDGRSFDGIARALACSSRTVRRFVYGRQKRPLSSSSWSPGAHRLSLQDREEISHCLVAGESLPVRLHHEGQRGPRRGGVQGGRGVNLVARRLVRQAAGRTDSGRVGRGPHRERVARSPRPSPRPSPRHLRQPEDDNRPAPPPLLREPRADRASHGREWHRCCPQAPQVAPHDDPRRASPAAARLVRRVFSVAAPGRRTCGDIAYICTGEGCI